MPGSFARATGGADPVATGREGGTIDSSTLGAGGPMSDAPRPQQLSSAKKAT